MVNEAKEDLTFNPYTFWDNPDYWTVHALDIPQYAAVNAKLTKEQINAIKNYGKEIQTIKLFVDSVRQNPGEYLSSIGNEGWMNGVREVIQNSTDEMDRDVSPCNSVWVEYFEGTHRCIVSDNGRGIPADDIVRVFTREHTSTNFKKKEGVFSSGLHGVGAKCTNAVSSRFTVQSYILGKAYQIDFSEGKPLPKYKNMKPKEIPNKGDRQGLVVDFEPDFKVMKEITITCADILQFLENLIPLLKIGAHIEFIGHLKNGKTVKKSLDNKNGVIDFITRQQVKSLIKPIVFGYTNGVMKVEVAMTYVSNPNLSANVLTFANMTPVDTQRSTPSKGFLDGLSQFFKNHMNRVYLASSKRKIEVTNGDVLTGLVGAVSSYHMSVMFDGQAKNVCKNLDFVDFVKQVTMKSLADWVKNNPDDLQKLCEFIKDVALARIRADKEKVNISKKYKGQSFWDLPDGYRKAENKDHLELFIVEGLSAAAPCSAGRNSKYQCIYAIRGKMANAMNVPVKKMLENKEVQGILTILGAGYGKHFDISKCRFDKVILLADADYDGAHIRTLVLKFLLLYCRPLVEAGRVYAALSPLYHVNIHKKNWSYFLDKNDFIRYVRDEFFKSHKLIHQMKKRPFTKAELSSLIIHNNNYDTMMDTISGNYAIYPVLLEDVLILRKSSFAQIKKNLEGKYGKFIHVKQEKGQIIVDGLINDMSHLFAINQNLINACAPLLPYIDKSEKRYVLDGKKIGLYELLKFYRESEPKNIERAKGLGSLNAYEIGYSTLDPARRLLIRYTAKDIEDEIEEIRKINDDQYQLIEDLDISQYEF